MVKLKRLTLVLVVAFLLFGTTNSSQASISVSASQIVREYVENEVAADVKYGGEQLTVTGNIDSIGKDMLKTIYITLDGGHTIRRVQCYFPDNLANQIANLKKGQQVRVEGTCKGLFMNVIIKDCKLK